MDVSLDILEKSSSSVSLHEMAERREYVLPAVKAALRITDLWSLTDQEASRMLNVRQAELQGWRSQLPDAVSEDVITRMSIILGIYKGLRMIFNTDDQRHSRWLRSDSRAAAFNGNTPLTMVTSGSLDDLKKVRDHLEFWGTW